jgi:hypothetical protein
LAQRLWRRGRRVRWRRRIVALAVLAAIGTAVLINPPGPGDRQPSEPTTPARAAQLR